MTQQTYSDLFTYSSSNNLNSNLASTTNHPHVEHSNGTRKINLPKTFSTKKGPLILFSEEPPTLVAPPHSLNTTSLSMYTNPKDTPRSNHRAASKYIESKSQSKFNDLNALKTINDLRKSILEFGSYDNSAQNTKRSLYDKEDDSFVPRLERKNTLESMSINKKLNNSDDLNEPKIRPGLSAKRYLANWTRHWKPQLYESLTNKGAIKQDNLFEPNSISPNTRQRIDDDITLVPPAYRIQRQWLASNVAPLKVYRFYRAQTDFLGFSM